MARNSQVTRQWLMLQALEGPAGATLEDLARALPEDLACSLRTIRRDLEALEVSFPIYTERIEGLTRWKLIEGFSRIPAVQLTPTEIMALAFMRDLAKPLEGSAIKDTLDAAVAKVSAALPGGAEEYLPLLQGWFGAGLGPHRRYREHRETIDQLSRAIAKHRTVEMRYYSASRDATTRRKVDPYHLWYAEGSLYLIAYCHLRRDIRMFAADRIRSLTVTNHPCQMPLGFDVEAYVRDALVLMHGEPLEVELRFDRSTSAWARDRIWHPSQEARHEKDGSLTLVLRLADTPELVRWILSFGAGVRVVRPNALREKVLSAAGALLSQA